MIKILFFFIMYGLVAFCLQIGNAQTSNQSVFVATSWLAEHLNDPSLVVLHVAPIRRDYERGHIVGARFLWPGWMAMSNPDLSYELLPVEQINKSFEALGISNDSRIVLCGIGGNVNPVARMFVTLDYLGMGDRTSILDGGFDAWKSEGRPVTKDVPVFRPGSFTPKLNQRAFVDAKFVRLNLQKSGVSVIDARAPQFYNGSNSGGYPRAGHIPGAANIFASTLVDSANKMLPSVKLREKFDSTGVKEGNDVIVYCHTGGSACLVYVAARSLGYTAHLYDGSFEEWSGKENFPIELPAKQDSSKK